MSFELPSIRPKPSQPAEFAIKENDLGAPNPILSELSGAKQKLGFSHPLEASERDYEKNCMKMDMAMLRDIQGIHAPIRRAMELKAAEKIGRLPFLPSSNLMRDVILGKDTEIGFEDILNTPEFREQMVQPHAVVERSLGIL